MNQRNRTTETRGDPYFPRDSAGKAVNLRAIDGFDVVAQLEGARSRGIMHLIVPSFSFDQARACAELVAYLAHRCRPAAVRPQVGLLFELRDPDSAGSRDL